MLLVSATNLFAGPRLNDLNIRVELCPNGDARITEVRQMSIDSEGTECYIVLGNLNGSKVTDLKVTDETGAQFENIGSWDIDRSRSWKEGKCGIVSKHDGYELCWGLGQSGIRTYTTSYVVTSLLRGYSDADGFIFPLQSRFSVDVPVVDGSIPMSISRGYKGRPGTAAEQKWLEQMLSLTGYMNRGVWKSNIRHISVEKSGDLILNPLEGKEKFVFGPPVRIPEKLGLMEKYYTTVAPTVAPGHYSVVDLRYRGQMICRK